MGFAPLDKVDHVHTFLSDLQAHHANANSIENVRDDHRQSSVPKQAQPAAEEKKLSQVEMKEDYMDLLNKEEKERCEKLAEAELSLAKLSH